MILDWPTKLSFDADPPAGDPPAGDPPAGDPPAGDPPAGDPPAGPLLGQDAPTEYSFAKIGEGDAAVDPPEELVTAVTEFAKANKLSQEQAQAILNRDYESRKQLPDEYTFEKIKDADGNEVDVDEAISKPVAEFAKEQGYTQEQAQALLNRELDLQKQADEGFQKAQQKLQNEWQATAMKDEMLNKDGKFKENMATVRRGFQKFFPELYAEMQKSTDPTEYMFLDHPVLLRGFLKIGELTSEDGELISSRKPEGAGRDSGKWDLNTAARKMYPNMFKS
jgi:hypothetical protein